MKGRDLPTDSLVRTECSNTKILLSADHYPPVYYFYWAPRATASPYGAAEGWYLYCEVCWQLFIMRNDHIRNGSIARVVLYDAVHPE